MNQKKKTYVDFEALADGLSTGRIQIWIDGNGIIYIRHSITGMTIETQPGLDMDDPDGYYKDPETLLYFSEYGPDNRPDDI